MAIKEQLENDGAPPDHFRVSIKNLWEKGFKQEVGNYQFVKDKLQDLSVAEENLNRNIDSHAQLDIFLDTANDVKTQFVKRYGAENWEP